MELGVRMPRLPTKALIALVVVGVGVAIVASAVLITNSQEPSPAASSIGTRTPYAACDGWGVGFASFDEAESQAGYHIPRAPASYQPLQGQTCLQPLGDPAIAPPISHTEYGCQADYRHCISVDVVASRYDVTNSREHGTPTALGDKTGWMLPSKDGDLTFSWKCGRGKEGSTLYCTVGTLGDVDHTTFDTFVASLR